jgi:hypothetical protein
MKGLSHDAQVLLEFIRENPGVTMIACATLLNRSHSIYGKQKAATLAIAELRRKGLIMDCKRCPYCGRALTRGRRNVALFATNGSKPHQQFTFL